MQSGSVGRVDASGQSSASAGSCAGRLVAAATVLSAGVTVLVVAAPGVPQVVRSAPLVGALESVAGCVALLAAWLAWARYRREGRARDGALTVAFVLFGLTDLAFGALPAVLEGLSWPAPRTWAALGGRLLGAVAFAGAALVPGSLRLRRPSSAVVILPIVLVVLVGATMGTLAGGPPQGVGGLAAAQVLCLALFVVAGAGFWRRLRREGDVLAGWLSAAAVLAAAARLHFLLRPPLYPDVVFTGDALRLGFYAVVLGASIAEFTAYWRGLADAAVVEERRRLARDLHDGVAQEVAFVASQVCWLEDAEHDPDRVRHLAMAAERALAESRRAIASLHGAGIEPLPVDLAAATVAAERLGVPCRVRLDDDVRLPPGVAEDVGRIVQEAVANAARHSGAQQVSISVSGGDRPVIEVADDGRGFDPAAAGRHAGSFGLASMRERADSIGATCTVDSTAGTGTVVRVAL
jgi:signal transduction histidine kinase